jgi:hypothetical protein
MSEINRTTTKGVGQGRSRGICRGIGIRQGRQSNMPLAESVIEPEERFRKTDLQMLKEQAERMTKALKNIRAQIETLSQSDT